MQHTDICFPLIWLQRQRGRFVSLTCGDAIVHLLLLSVHRSGDTWWLSGYDEGNIGEPLMISLTEVTRMRGERKKKCPSLRR